MASAKCSASQPAFPDDLQPIAQIATVSLAKLVAGDTGEAEAVLHACRTLGFFLLDLTGDSVGENLISEVDAVFDVVRQTMELSMEEKNKFAHDPPGDFRG
jgi:isopenicillin N synthase-like dioxygenase